MNIIVSGCCGTMGSVLIDTIAKHPDCRVIAGIDIAPCASLPFPVFSSPDKCPDGADVIIDFSHPKNLSLLLDTACLKKIPTVIATTGYNEAQTAKIAECARDIPIFFSANMSLGVSLLKALCRKAASVLGNEYDIEIIEKHHNKKIDAPSGTAIMLAQGIEDALDFAPKYVYDRHSRRAKREPHEIGMHSVRGGSIVGEHEIIFAGSDEIITLAHSAMSKAVFASGAISAARFLIGKPAALYSMDDII